MRRSGRTTRLADEAIQFLFENGTCCIADHHNTTNSNNKLLLLILKRLDSEHGIDIGRVGVSHVEGAYIRITIEGNNVDL